MNAITDLLTHRALSPTVALRILSVLITSPFWISGLSKLIDWKSAVLEMAQYRLSPPALFAAATLLVELLGSAMLIGGPYRWLGAIALSGFTALTIPISHHFWNQVGTDRETSLDFAIEHMAVIGGLLAVAWLSVASGLT